MCIMLHGILLCSPSGPLSCWYLLITLSLSLSFSLYNIITSIKSWTVPLHLQIPRNARQAKVLFVLLAPAMAQLLVVANSKHLRLTHSRQGRLWWQCRKKRSKCAVVVKNLQQKNVSSKGCQVVRLYSIYYGLLTFLCKPTGPPQKKTCLQLGVPSLKPFSTFAG